MLLLLLLLLLLTDSVLMLLLLRLSLQGGSGLLHRSRGLHTMLLRWVLAAAAAAAAPLALCSPGLRSG